MIHARGNTMAAPRRRFLEAVGRGRRDPGVRAHAALTRSLCSFVAAAACAGPLEAEDLELLLAIRGAFLEVQERARAITDLLASL